MYFHYRVTFTVNIQCFCATTSHDLLILKVLSGGALNSTHSLTLESVSYTVLLVPDPYSNVDYPTYIGYWVTITESLITFPLSETVNAHAPCHVTYQRGRCKNDPHFWNPCPNLPIHFVTFRALRRRLSIGENSVYPIVKATKFTTHVQYHVTCAYGVPKTTHNNFLTPNIQLLWGYDDD